MFSRQKRLLAQAESEHRLAVEQRVASRQELRRSCHRFLGKPLNLLYPFAAGALICASQLKNEATGLQRIPFLGLAKSGVGIWATFNRIQKIRKNKLADNDQSDQL